MRIALVTETFLPSVDGVVTRMTHAVDWLVDHGHELCVVAPDLGVSDYRGVPVLGVKAVTWPFYRSRAWGTPSPRVARYLREFRPDVVHAWQPALVGFPAVAACTRGRVPLVTSYHTDLSSYLDYYGPVARLGRRLVEWYQRRENNLSPLTLVTSRAMQRKLEDMGVRGVSVLPRGVDLAMRDPRFASDGMRARLTGGRPERPLIVYVGRVAAEKNLESLLPVMRAHPDWSLAIVGDGPALSHLKQAFAGTPTTFTGFMGGEELAAAFASADVFAFPSTTETLGLVILESQASGTPVVAAASPATVEQLRDGENGLVYDPSDPGALGRALERLLSPSGGGLARRIAQAGIDEARQNGWERASAAVYDAYEATLALYAEGWEPPHRPGRRPR